VIQRVQIENFRALTGVDVELRPLTILVGPNDSGKSSFLDAINRISRGAVERQDWRCSQSQPPQIRLLNKNDHPFVGDIELFKLPSQGIPMVSVGVADDAHRGAPPLHSTGMNLAAFLDYLLRKDRKRFDQIQASLRQLVPGFEEISITTPSADTRSVLISLEQGLEISGERLSTGVRMLFFFVALAYHPNPPQVVLIEEPENGVHPKRLKDIVDLLRSLTAGKLSSTAVQVLVSTHSPYLLDHIRLPEDQVLVFRRERNGDRKATAVDQQRLKIFLDEFMLGEVWFNQGEEGLLAPAR
jgi:predicted ATPase